MVRKQKIIKKKAPKKSTRKKNTEDFIRKRKIRFAVNKVSRAFQYFLLLVILIVSIWMIFFDGYEQVRTAFRQSLGKIIVKAGFELTEVEITGNKTVTYKDIVSAIYANNEFQEIPILMLDLEEVQKNISAVGWVDTANLRIKLPDTLIVEVVERKPSFIWMQDNKSWLSDIGGNLISYKVGNKNLTLPIIKGSDSKKDVSELYDVISTAPELRDLVTGATKIGNRRWDVELKKSIKIKLPEKDAITAWRKLSTLNKQSNLLGKKISYIDMRIENQIITGF